MSRSRITNAHWFPLGFVLAAMLLMLFWILLLATFVVHVTYVDRTGAGEGSRLESIWSWLVIGSLGWGLVNLYWASRSARASSEKGFYGHFAIATGCGLIALGIQGVMAARSLTLQPLVLDYSQSFRTTAMEPPTSDTAVLAGDAEEGRKLFSTTCITCHGPNGQGMPNLAPSLVGSSFISSAEDAAVANVVRAGRALGDPANKSGKVMPAKGGNPFLTEEQVWHLVAFVRVIQDGGEVSTDPSSTPAVQLARWVVPAAPPPPTGINRERADAEQDAGAAKSEKLAQRRDALMRALTVGLLSVHGLFLLGLITFSSNLMMPRLLTGRSSADRSSGSLAINGWVIAAVSWLLITIFCFWWS